MTYMIFIYSIQISILIIEAATNQPQSESSVQIFNTETVILSLGDPDDAKNDDLEIIKAPSGKSALEKKLTKFHRYVNSVEITEDPQEKFLHGNLNKKKSHKQAFSAFPQNPSIEMEEEEDERLFNDSRRRNKKRKKKKLRYRQLHENSRSIKKRQVTSCRTRKKLHCKYLEKEYLDFVNQKMLDRTAFKYSDEGKPEETIKEVFYKITDIKTPKDCTKYSGVGVQAVECVVEMYKSGQLRQRQMFYIISLIVLVWFGVYLATVLPLWCLKGWCCCCCRCEFCFPKKTVREIQKYIEKNPPGVHTNSNNEEEHHNSTQNEIELYEQLKRLIAEF